MKQPRVPFPRVSAFSADTQSGTLGRRLSNHNIFWQPKILKFFANRPIKINIKTVQLMWTLNHSNLLDLSGNSPQIYECYCSICKTTWDSFVFRKRWDWTIFFQVSRFECQHCNRVWTSIILPLYIYISRSFFKVALNKTQR